MAPQKAAARKAVGDELAAVLPQNPAPWYRRANLLRLNFSILSLVLFSSANGYDGSMMNGLQTLDQWHTFMHSPTGAWLGFLNAVQSFGSLANFPVAAWAGNRFGRKWCIAVGYAYLALGTGLQAGATSDTMFILGRLFIGGTSAWYSVTTPLLIAETAFPTQRGVLTSMFNCGWYVGALTAAWVTYGSQDMASSWAWRVPSVMQAGIPAVAIAGYLMAPESPRWLVSKGRVEEARAFFVKYHAEGDANAAIVDFELAEVQKALKMEQEAAQSTSYFDLFKSAGNRRRLFISISLGVFAQWNGVGNVSYYLSAVLDTAGVKSVRDQTVINGCIQIWNLLWAVAGALLVDRLGRRFLFMTSCAGMLASYITISALAGSYDTTGNAATGVAVIPMLFLYYASYDIAFTPLLFAYPCEIWPYTLRARGLTTMIVTTQLALCFNIFVNPIALEDIAWRYYIVFAVILIFVGLTCYFCYPETRGHSLEEIAKIFDGEAADVSAAHLDDHALRQLSSTEKEPNTVQLEDVDAEKRS